MITTPPLDIKITASNTKRQVYFLRYSTKRQGLAISIVTKRQFVIPVFDTAKHLNSIMK